MSHIVRIRGQWVPDDEIEKKRPKEAITEAEVKISRFDPSVDKTPHVETYKVPLYKDIAVLGVLDYIYENIDSSLAYYQSCRGGGCGACTAIINGKPGLTCATLATEKMLIEPLKGFEIVKDLVVKQFVFAVTGAEGPRRRLVDEKSA